MRAIAIAHVVGDATMTPDDVVAWLEAQTLNYRPLCTLVQSEWLSPDRIDSALRSIVSQFAHGLGVLTPTEKANKAKWDREQSASCRTALHVAWDKIPTFPTASNTTKENAHE